MKGEPPEGGTQHMSNIYNAETYKDLAIDELEEQEEEIVDEFPRHFRIETWGGQVYYSLYKADYCEAVEEVCEDNELGVDDISNIDCLSLEAIQEERGY